MAEEKKTWLHIGAGSFHRAHQAWYMHRLIQAGASEWGIALANIRDDVTPVLEKLAAQDNKYTLETVDAANRREYELITSIRQVVRWDAALGGLIDVGADNATRVISFTVTEGGYYLDTANKLEQDNPDIAADLGGALTTIYGTIAAVLQRRMELGGTPVTLLCCDNVRHNGERFRSGLLEFVALRGDSRLGEWIAANASCPCCMVDRITPRPSPEVAERVLAVTGFADQAPVMAESFIQWVIEDNFINGRPALEQVGAEMVADVQPYEEAKIRLLNVTHAGIAWAGTLAGLSYIHESTLHPAIGKMAYDYITDDAIPCLTPSPLDLEQYRDTVLECFSNANILDTNARVSADGYSKIPAMIVPTLVECYRRGVQPKATAMLPALFFLFLQRWHENALPFAYYDGVMDPAKARAMFESADPLASFIADPALFGPMSTNADFAALLRDCLKKASAWVAGTSESL